MKLILDLENLIGKMALTKRTCKISKNNFGMFISMPKSIEFHLPHCDIPQLSSYYCWCTVVKIEQRGIVLIILSKSSCGILDFDRLN